MAHIPIGQNIQQAHSDKLVCSSGITYLFLAVDFFYHKIHTYTRILCSHNGFLTSLMTTIFRSLGTGEGKFDLELLRIAIGLVL